MFCPNCAAKNSVELNYCRSCGLKLERIVEAIAEQLPSQVDAAMQRRKEKAERAALIHLSIVALVGLALTVFFYTQYTNLGYYFGALLFGASVLMIFLLLPALGRLYNAKFVLKPKYLPQEAEVPISTPLTAKLIDDRSFEPAVSVSENTTESLKVPGRDLG